MNRYLQDKANRDMARGRGRNPYGSRGGYVTSRRGRGRDRGMYDMADYGDYDMARGGSQGRGRDRDMARGGRDGHYPMEYELYGVGGMRPMMNDFAQDDYARGGRGGRGSRGGRDNAMGDMADYDYGMDYGYDMGRNRDYRSDYDYDYGYDYGYDYDYEKEDKKWKQHLKKWCEELKRHDRFNMPKEQIIQTAKQMGVSFDKYNEEEFITTYYMVMSDYPQIANEPHTYLSLAKDWLEDKDSKLKGSEKLCAYYYEVIKGGEEQ